MAMGLFDKTNPRATWRSVLRGTVVSAAVGGVFFLLFKPQWRESWLALAVWVTLCALVGAIFEWQVPVWKDEDCPDDEPKDAATQHDAPPENPQNREDRT